MAKQSSKPSKYRLTVKNLRWALRSNPAAVSFESLATGFGLNKDTKAGLSRRLGILMKSGDVQKDEHGRYVAKDPISDIVLAQVEETSGKKRRIRILNLEHEGEEFPIYMHSRLVDKLEKRQGKTVKKGDVVAVLLERRSGVDLHVKNLIGVIKPDKKALVTVEFEKASKPEDHTDLRVLYPSSRGDFKVASIDRNVGSKGLKGLFRASIGLDYDPENPLLHVESKRWEQKTGMPVAMIVARKNGIPLRHSPEAEAEARHMVRQNYWADKNRHDFRGLPILVIDPANAHDHDDGIYVEPSTAVVNGKQAAYRSLVVFPDIPFYVRSGSVLDKEAKERGFSHYFGQDAVHMYPDVIPCRSVSLRDKKTRPVIFVGKFWDKNGKALAPAHIGTAVIDDQKVMTYGRFQDLVEMDDPEIWAYQELGDHLMNNMRADRTVTLDSVGHNLSASYAQAFVSAFMQDANEEIANFLHERDVPFLRRAHAAKMNPLAYEGCREYLTILGYDMPDEVEDLTASVVHNLLAQADSRGERTQVESYVKQYMLHIADYTTSDIGHFGLGADRYGHFSSPIRRYADTLGLRAVHTALGDEELGLSRDDIDYMNETAATLNQLQQVSRNTAVDYIRFNAVSRLMDYEGIQRNAKFTSVTYPYVNIDLGLPKKGSLRKKIHVQDLPRGWTVAMDGQGLQYDTGNGRRLYVAPGDTVKMTIQEVNPEKGDWSFIDLHPKSAVMLDFVSKRRQGAGANNTQHAGNSSTVVAMSPPSAFGG